ncbi:MAG: UDP-N-acetylglucosamine 2-epimerase (non-hydrolyzing) [Candidatus Sericytochromatia bacterium]|nr:UDP-N-acetylglucosamine 2-epimerase (non-hydrolyzing) [Candidatus Sericytochromatia bacterium]
MKPLVMTVFGTRPEAVKMAPLVLALQACPDLDVALTVTAQHREMLDQVLDLFGLVPDHDLDLMKAGQSLTDITTRVLTHLGPVLDERKPSLVLVHGDTTTTFAASLAAFYRQIPVGHVEAGLRTPDRYNPYPEEMNRRLTTQLASLHFAPTATSEAQLRAENVAADAIYRTGNTVIDALLMTARRLPQAQTATGRQILVTAHRRENWGEPLAAICRAIRRLVEAYADVRVLFPIHRNPVVRETAQAILGGHPRIEMIEPLDYAPFVAAMRDSYLILTDSGGVQEEAPSLGKPVLVLRTTTERPEAIDAGTVELVGVDEERIVTAACRLLDDPSAYERMARAVNPYGDGHACERIVNACRYHLGVTTHRPTALFGADVAARG